MTREEKQKAIDALKISAPLMAVTQEEFNDYIQILNQVMDWLEQEPCDDCISRQAIKRKLQEHHDFFINAYGGFSNMSQNDKSRVDEIINCIAMVVNEPSVTSKQQPCEDAISRQAILDIIMPYCQDDDGSVENTGDLRNALDDIESLPPVTPKEKSEYEHDHDVVKAYNDGQAFVLDKIRAEIEEIVKTEANQDKKWASGLRYSLKIIDKYRGEQIILKKRTPEEMKAYVEGYNACNEMFKKHLKKERSVEEAIKTMDALVFALSYGVTGKERSNGQRRDKDGICQ